MNTIPPQSAGKRGDTPDGGAPRITSETLAEVAAYLATGRTREQIAKELGFSIRQVRRCIEQYPQVRIEAAAIRRVLAEHATGAMAACLADAVARLALVAEGGKDGDAIKAADMLLSHYLRYEDACSTSARLERLEAAMGLVAGAVKETGAESGADTGTVEEAGSHDGAEKPHADPAESP